MPRKGYASGETPEVKALVRRRVELWKRALARGDADVLAQAVVEQREIPEELRERVLGQEDR